MTTQEFLSKYGWWKSIYYNPSKSKVLWNGKYDKRGCRQVQRYVLCECTVCHEEDWVRWQPGIVYKTVENRRFTGEKGYYLCPDCVDYTKVAAGSEYINDNKRHSEAARKGIETKKQNGWYDTEEFLEAQHKSHESAVKNGTFMKEQEIDGLIRHFGGEHFPCGSFFPDGHRAKMEADWINHEKKVVIEIDDPKHEKYRANYHHEKRAYWESEGYRILNIAVNRSNKKCIHPRRDGYTFLSLCEAHVNGTLPRELEIMWNDPWYING